ncbi:MAG: hypothetical protein FJ143_08165 [Deltaproteobacteria bacterium]|nr:hypothetical protein [Deltaproteobacteria bacterium]
MPRIFAAVVGLILLVSGLAWAAERHGARRTKLAHSHSVPLERRSVHSTTTIFVPYQTPVLVISPYGPSYYLPPAVVVTSPYFCVLHNDGFVSRIGLLDHLAGTHKLPLDVAAAICPDGVGSCVFPSY